MAGYIRRAEKYMQEIALSEDPELYAEITWKHWKAVCDLAAKFEKIHMDSRIEAGIIPKPENHSTSSLKDKWWFVTIRPNKKTFEEFKERFESRILPRKIIKEIKYCYEQKGTTDDTLGTGHHLHAIIRTAHWYTPGNLARDLLSSMNGFCGNAGIKVSLSKNPEEHFDRYCVNHKSEDGHKEITAVWDKKWRELIGLQDVYTPALNQVREGGENTNSGPDGNAEVKFSNETVTVNWT